jgi:membrane-bound ClpP family serine protease
MNPEILGLIATIIVFISFTFKNIKWLRIVDTIGAVVFVVYACLINAWSLIICNAGIAIVNITYLLLAERKKRKQQQEATDSTKSQE